VAPINNPPVLTRSANSQELVRLMAPPQRAKKPFVFSEWRSQLILTHRMHRQMNGFWDSGRLLADVLLSLPDMLSNL
jgi:hypothetical protein